MMTGFVKAVRIDRGFGFIACADGSPDVFFHANDVERVPFDEQLLELRVEFGITETGKGRRAMHVQPKSTP